jgi:hypothetical protein
MTNQFLICIIIDKDSARQIISNQESEETKLVELPDKAENNDIATSHND